MTQLFEKHYNADSLWKIVNISSTAWIAPWTFTWWLRSPDYSCAKAALDLYTQQCAKLYEWRILVNGVAPGSTKTPPWESATEEFLEIRAKEAIIWRFMEASEIAHSVIYCLENDTMNGEIIVVDWGNQLN
jgi:NAD(P)-dependent dehydrogenase (short-subunit alcohol dehydrogenase family)